MEKPDEGADALTGDYDHRRQTGEGGNVKLHPTEGLGKLQDGVDPVPEASHTLRLVKHGAFAEDELLRFWVGALKQQQRKSGNINNINIALAVFGFTS